MKKRIFWLIVLVVFILPTFSYSDDIAQQSNNELPQPDLQIELSSGIQSELIGKPIIKYRDDTKIAKPSFPQNPLFLESNNEDEKGGNANLGGNVLGTPDQEPLNIFLFYGFVSLIFFLLILTAIITYSIKAKKMEIKHEEMASEEQRTYITNIKNRGYNKQEILDWIEKSNLPIKKEIVEEVYGQQNTTSVNLAGQLQNNNLYK